MRRLFFILIVVAAAAVFLPAPALRLVDRTLNATRGPGISATPETLALHDSLWIADLHTDALLWGRDLLERSTTGHVDLPRLRAGGVEFQVFSATTVFHATSNYRRTPPLGDLVGLVALARHWPRSAWFDPTARALEQARALEAMARASRGGLRVVESSEGFDSLLADQDAGADAVGAILLVEGLHALGGRVDGADRLFAAGFRVFGIAHMFDNEAAGSAHGWNQGGLTPFGRRALARLDSLGAIIDLAHGSDAAVRDALAATQRPVLVSHTGVDGTCPGPRNLGDDVLAAVGARGGLVGIGFWEQAVCGRDAAAIARAIVHAARVAGVEHVALGSDFDGAVRTPFDAAGLPALTQALLEEGLSPEEVRLVMGANARRFFRETLPPRTITYP